MKTIAILTDSKEFEETPLLMYYWNEYPVTSIVKDGAYLAGCQLIKVSATVRFFVTDSEIIYKAIHDNTIRAWHGILQYDGSQLDKAIVDNYMEKIS